MSCPRNLLWAIGLTCLAVPSSAAEPQVRLTGTITDTATGQPVAARLYVERMDDGTFHLVQSAAGQDAIAYDRVNTGNPRSIEKHTTLPAGPFEADLPPGRYRLTAERGKEYFPLVREVELTGDAVEVELPLVRWINLAERGWYSGETHLHRSLAEMPLLVQAEDLNVSLPLTYWVTEGFTPPAGSDRNQQGEIPAELIEVDDTHVIWPRNTEYEIFTLGKTRHTLGALFLLNHREPLAAGVPPWRPAIKQAVAEGAVMDMDKLDWPFGMTLPEISGATLYELANNHVWRTEFAFRDWNTVAPPYLQPPAGGKSGGEREWLHYTWGMYYTLLNAGYDLVPTAGTASGVHPVPPGFSRVYVHLPEGFSYEGWLKGLLAGRSFVTTGPMLFAELDGQQPGNLRRTGKSRGNGSYFGSGGGRLKLSGSVEGEFPTTLLEVVINGVPRVTIFPENKPGPQGQYVSQFTTEVEFNESGYVCLRAIEERPDGRIRFAHTAPWWITVGRHRLKPTAEEREYLIRRVRDEIARSGPLLPPKARQEYQKALEKMEALESRPEEYLQARVATTPAERDALLENMLVEHRLTDHEALRALKISRPDLASARRRLAGWQPTRVKDRLKVLPYPGGRHPRRGFLDGAVDPQRETKVSVFTPWDPASYVVVDVPEAIFSNLGLTYLAHTHVPTLWTAQGIELPRLEWLPTPAGGYEIRRKLPNGIEFGAVVQPGADAVRMELWLKNGTPELLTGLRVQNCVMLSAAAGFTAQTPHNKRLAAPFAACHDEGGTRWVITAWEPNQRTWTNPPCPCLHSDPQFPDCPPGETRRVRGWLSFYEGTDIEAEFRRIDQEWERKG